MAGPFRKVTGRRTRGVTVVGYALLLGLISVIGLLAITSVGDEVTGLFNRTGETLGGVTSGEVVATEPCTGNGSATFSIPGHAGELNGQTLADFTLNITPDIAGCIFSITVTGAGGGGTESNDGGYGGQASFDYLPDATGSFTVLVGQGGTFSLTPDHTLRAIGGGGAAGQFGTFGEDEGGGGGGASAISFNGTLVAIAGGGGGGGPTPNCPTGNAAQPGGNAPTFDCDSIAGRGGDGGAGTSSSGSGGAGADNTTPGGAGGSSSVGSAQNGSNGGDNPGTQGGLSGGLGGLAVPAFSVSGGGGGAGDPDGGAGGGGGFGGGGGGGGDGSISAGGGGAGGGGYLLVSPRISNVSTGNGGNGGAAFTQGGDGSVTISW